VWWFLVSLRSTVETGMMEGEMTDAPQPERGRPPRWDSYPMGHASPRWDAGVRYWPGGVLLVGLLVLYVALNVAFGWTGGPLATALVVVMYPIVLIVAPFRRRLVPREVGTTVSPVRLRVWVLGWLCIAAGIAGSTLAIDWNFSGPRILGALAFAVCDVPIIFGVVFVMRAPAWEQWIRRRPRRNGPQTVPTSSIGTSNGSGPPTTS
jgi:hypothetical protein